MHHDLSAEQKALRKAPKRRGHPRRRTSAADIRGTYYAGVAVLTIGAPQLVGGVFAWGTVTCAVAACLCLGLSLLAVRNSDRLTLEREPCFAIAGLMVLVGIFHIVPLPVSLVAKFAPDPLDNARSLQEAFAAAAPKWLPLTLDINNTSERLLYIVAVASSFFAARILAVGGRSTPVLIVVAASTILVALSYLGHRAVGAVTLYGVYKPYIAGRYGPLPNPNNLAGFMALGAPLCVGLAGRQIGPARYAWLLAAAVVTATGLLAGSRAGVAALLVAPVLFVVGLWFKRSASSQSFEMRTPARGRWISGATAVLGAALFYAAAYLLAEVAAEDFLETNYSDLTKLDLLRAQTFALLRTPTQAILGIGPGAFGAWFTRAAALPTRVLYSECLPLQLATEFGIPTAALVIGLSLARVFPALSQWRSIAHLGGLVGLFALTLQNLVDFSLQLTGIAVPAAVCMAAVLPQQAGSTGWHRLRLDLRKGAFLLLAGGGVLLVILGSAVVTGDLLPNERFLERAHLNRDSKLFWLRFRDVAPGHAGEAALMVLAASRAVDESSPQAGYWLNRVMVLAPGWSAPHLLSARWLWTVHRPDQAATELQLAGETNAEGVRSLLCSWMAETASSDFVIRAVPERGPNRLILLDAVAECTSQRPGVSAAIDGVLLKEEPKSANALLRRAQRALQASDAQGALREARAARQISARSARSYLIEARALSQLGYPDRALAALAQAPSGVDNRDALLLARVQLLTKMADGPRMREAIDQMRMVVAGTAGGLVSTAVLLGRCELELGNDVRALKAFEEARELGDGEESAIQVAKIARRLGKVDYALRVWEQLCIEHKTDEYCQTYRELRSETNAPVRSDPPQRVRD